jgi:hypothetical protein
MTAATSIVPFQPPVGLPPSRALAHAVDHIGKVLKKHEILRRDNDALRQQFQITESEWKTTAKKHYATVIEMMLSGAAGAGLGYVNGRWSKGKDHATIYGAPVDATTLAVAHIGGVVVGLMMDDELGQHIARGLHAVGNVSTSVVTYRLAYEKGVEARVAAAAVSPGAPANGVKGGTVYAAPGAPAHK